MDNLDRNTGFRPGSYLSKTIPWHVEDRRVKGVTAQILEKLSTDQFPFAVYGRRPPFALGSVLAVIASDGEHDHAFANEVADRIAQTMNGSFEAPALAVNSFATDLISVAGVDPGIAIAIANEMYSRGWRRP